MTSSTITTLAGVLILIIYMVNQHASASEPLPTLDPAQWGPVQSDSDNLPTEDTQQTTTTLEDAFVAINPSTYASGQGVGDPDANVSAFLDMIAYSEGTAGPEGYRTMFGHRLFDSFADHPRQYFSFTNSLGQQLKTSAAGRYQFLASTWDSLKQKLGLQDFSPASQDAGCIELIRQRGALPDVQAGRTSAAITKCAPVWASLPGAGYNQPERKLSQLLAAYTSAGGTTAEA